MSIIENAAKRLEQARRASPGRAGTEPGLREAHGQAKPLSSSLVPIPINTGAGNPDAARVIPRRFATIDIERLQRMGMAIPSSEPNVIAEEFRVIKRPLLRNASDARKSSADATSPSNLVMVTSSLPNEGKTFCAVNLALSIAMEKDYTVLLVEADVARPSILTTLGISAETGLMDLLQNASLNVADVLLHTNVPSLSIIPAGKGNRHATELLASQDMARLTGELASRYADRIVIFDSPPVLATTNAQALAMHMGQIVVVVEAERTTQNQLKETLRILEDCSGVSLLYNKGRGFANESKYYAY